MEDRDFEAQSEAHGQEVEAQSWLSKAIGVDINLKKNPVTGPLASKAEAEAIIQVVKNLDNDTLERVIRVAQETLAKRKK